MTNQELLKVYSAYLPYGVELRHGRTTRQNLAINLNEVK